MRDRSDWPLVPVNRLYKSPPTAACWRLPVVEQAIPLAMAERVEVIVDFSAYPLNTTVTLDDQNAPLAERSVLQFIVVRKVRDDSRVPDRLAEISAIVPTGATERRSFVFTRADSSHSETRWSINGKEFDAARAIAEVSANDIELWRLANHSFREKRNVVHPVHLHLANFQILTRNGKPPPPMNPV